MLKHIPICSSVALNRNMQWARIWRKQVSLGERWSIAGENKLNHKMLLSASPPKKSCPLLEPLVEQHEVDKGSLLLSMGAYTFSPT